MTAEEDMGFRSNNYQHDLLSMAIGETVTFHAGSGTDTDTNRYLGLGNEIAYAASVLPTNVITITKINGADLKAAIQVGTGGWETKNTKIGNITLQAAAADVVSVEMRG